MDAMDVLGALLGNKSAGGSRGGGMLNDILRGQTQKTQPAPQRQPAPQHRTAPSSSTRQRPESIGDAARSLEDLLNVSNSRYQERHPQARQTPATEPHRAPEPEHSPAPRSQPRYTPPTPAEEDTLNEQSTTLIRAMIGAAKADGQMDQQEQERIVSQLGHLSPKEIQFLREEFARPSDVKELAWNVPLGMEEQVYSMSLIAIDLDENKEAEYLADLAHGLRLQPKRCNAIHRKFKAPEIFRE